MGILLKNNYESTKKKYSQIMIKEIQSNLKCHSIYLTCYFFKSLPKNRKENSNKNVFQSDALLCKTFKH
jgi:hypothetical protein